MLDVAQRQYLRVEEYHAVRFQLNIEARPEIWVSGSFKAAQERRVVVADELRESKLDPAQEQLNLRRHAAEHPTKSGT